MDFQNNNINTINEEQEPLIEENNIKNFQKYEKIKEFLGYLLFLLLGIAPQIMQNSLFSETFIFKKVVPEEKGISALIVTYFMIANIFCLIYLIIQQYRPISDKVFIYIILVGNVLDSILMIFLWNKNENFPGLGKISYIIGICSFIAGALGNTSTLVFFAFASHYKPFLTTALSAGYGISGLITSCLSIIQEALIYKFGIEYFFIIISVIVIISIIGYCIIIYTKLGKTLKYNSEESYSEYEEIPLKDLIKSSWDPITNMFFISIFTFFTPALIPFMAKDNDKMMNYLNSIFLIFPPLGAAFAAVYKFYYLTITSAVQGILFLYLFLDLLTKTHGILPNNDWLIFILLSIFSLLSGYNTTMVYLKLRKNFMHNLLATEKVSRWAAFANQIGAMIGIFINDGLIKGNFYIQ